MPTESRRLALVIASSQFRDPTLQQLQAPGRDAAALARVLSDPAVGGFEVQELVDRESHEVRREIARFFADRKRDDLMLLYFSGHGLKTDDGKLYLATIDTERGLPWATTVEASFVNEVMSASASRRQVLILDCCHSGAFASGMVAKGGGSADIKERFDGQGRVVLTASNAIQPAFELEDRSVFTRHLVHGLETGDADHDGDGRIALSELYDYVYARVVEGPSKQLPQMWVLKIEGPLYVARSPKGARPVGTEETRLAEQYRRGMEALSAGRWEEAADWLGKLADDRPDYRDVADRVQPLRDLAARMASLGPADRGWRGAVSRWPIVAMLVAVIIPNALASHFNYAYNDKALIGNNTDLKRAFDNTALAVNLTAFPVGLAAIIRFAWPVARGLRRRRAGDELAVEELKPLRDRCLSLGHFAAGIGAALWTIAGPIYPISLHLQKATLSGNHTVYFIVSLALGGLVAAAYPFFAVTFLSVRVVYPALVRPGSTRTDDRVRLERLDNSTWWYLLLAGSVPTVVISIALLGATGDEHKFLPYLGLGSFAGLAVAFWLCRVLQRDLAVLKQLVTRSRAGKG